MNGTDHAEGLRGRRVADCGEVGPLQLAQPSRGGQAGEEAQGARQAHLAAARGAHQRQHLSWLAGATDIKQHLRQGVRSAQAGGPRSAGRQPPLLRASAPVPSRRRLHGGPAHLPHLALGLGLRRLQARQLLHPRPRQQLGARLAQRKVWHPTRNTVERDGHLRGCLGRLHVYGHAGGVPTGCSLPHCGLVGSRSPVAVATQSSC